MKRFVRTEKRVNQYALVKLHFMRSNNLNGDLQVEVNSRNLIVDAKTLRLYFEIEYSDNMGRYSLSDYGTIWKGNSTDST